MFQSPESDRTRSCRLAENEGQTSIAHTFFSASCWACLLVSQATVTFFLRSNTVWMAGFFSGAATPLAHLSRWLQGRQGSSTRCITAL